MDRLGFVIALTSDMDRMKEFYGDEIGLEIASTSPFFVAFESEPGAPSLGLVAVPPEQKREIELCFAVRDIDAEVATLRRRGVEFIDQIRDQPFGRIIHLRGPEGNLVSLLQSSGGGADEGGAAGGGTAVAVGTRPQLTTAILNCHDLTAVKEFYRDRLGLRLKIDSPSWVEFEIGPTRLALHPLIEKPAREGHHGQGVTLGFAVDDLISWADEARERGVHFSTTPVDEGWGRFADATDPEGYELTFREPASTKSVEEELAEPFEDDDAPQLSAIRKPVQKAPGGARLAAKPNYHSKTKAIARKKSERSISLAIRQVEKLEKAVSPRGSGPAGTRQKPKRVRDPKRARNRPALGRQKKAERRTRTSQKRAEASASKGKPIKRGVAARGRKR